MKTKKYEICDVKGCRKRGDVRLSKRNSRYLDGLKYLCGSHYAELILHQEPGEDDEL